VNSWLGWGLILAGVYVLVMAARVLIQLWYWFIDQFFSEPWEPEPSVGPATPGHSESGPASSHAKRHDEAAGGYARWILLAAAPVALLHWLAAPVRFLHRLLYNRKYDYWVGCALAEDDARKKAKYLAKALALNPGYAPGWGLRATALLKSKQYHEALKCLDKLLEIDPNPIAWYEKGLCYYHQGQFREAMQCFDKALADCPEANNKLREDVLHQRKLAEGQLTIS
jgi:tetratricopeptide (TPR) repeat protein